MKKILALLGIFANSLFANPAQTGANEYEPREFYPSIVETKVTCSPQSTLKYWFVGASEIGASYIQSIETKNKGFNLFFAIGPRYNFTQKKASSYGQQGHSLALKFGLEYFRFLQSGHHDDLLFASSLEYSYVSEGSFGIAIGLSGNVSTIRTINSNLTAGVSLSFMSVFVRGEYVIVPFDITSPLTNTFKVGVGYKF